MKVAIITDQHFGARNDSINFLDYYEKFYSEIFFPKLIENKITTLLILGDTFDRRKHVNFYTLKRAKEMFFDKLHIMGITVHMLVGNHCTFFKNTNEVNSPELLFEEYDNINVISSPQTIHLKYEHESHDICMIPWICAENYENSMSELKNTKSKLCMGHFEIAGFSMHKGMKSEEGLSRDIFKRFNMVFSGHYHHKSNESNISYLGNPYQLTWSDYGDPRGFHIFDLHTRNLEFVENTNVMFHKFLYDDKIQTVSQINNEDLSKYKNTYVKLIVINKNNPNLFDQFVNKLYDVNPIDVSIVEDFSDLTESVDDDAINDAEDTFTIISKYIDSINEENINNTKLNNIMRELYFESLNLEKI